MGAATECLSSDPVRRRNCIAIRAAIADSVTGAPEDVCTDARPPHRRVRGGKVGHPSRPTAQELADDAVLVPARLLDEAQQMYRAAAPHLSDDHRRYLEVFSSGRHGTLAGVSGELGISAVLGRKWKQRIGVRINGLQGQGLVPTFATLDRIWAALD